MSRRRTWGSVTRYGAGWRARAGDDERTTVGIYLDRDFDGDEDRSKAAADEALAEAHRTWRAEHRPSKGRGITLVDYGRKILARWDDEGTRRGLKQDRWRFERHLARAPFAGDPIVSLERRAVQRWIRAIASGVAEGPSGNGERKRSRQTTVHVLNLLRAILRAAIEEEILDESPALGVIVPRSPRVHEEFLLLEQPEVDAILAREPDDRVSLERLSAVVVAIMTGMRPGELWGLRWADAGVSPQTGDLVVRYNRNAPTKGGRVRRVPLLKPARAALSDLWRARKKELKRTPRGDELVWPGPGGEPFAEGFDAGWAPRLQRIGGRASDHAYRYSQLGLRWELGVHRRVPFKDLRHTCACALLRGWWVGRGWIERPLSMQEVAAWLGHRSITTTERHYARLAPGGLLDVVPRKEG